MEQLLDIKDDKEVGNRVTSRISAKDKKFIRYVDGAEVYSMHQKTFEKLAKDANARYKVGKLVLVNTQIIDKYLETCRVIDT